VKYRTVVVDSPWSYKDKLAGFRGVTGTNIRGAENQYACMTQADIQRIPIGEWADIDAHLYLWATNAFMEEAHQLARAWGFRQRTILTWVKPQFGMGHYYRNNTEHVLFCVRGKLRTLRHDVPTAFTAPRGAHSEKPAAFYDMVESMSPGPYLDVFARKLRFRWDAWGDEVGAPDGLPTPQEVAAATGEEGA
jgi:N6-adenosine-specific RNA methylase IME4